MKQPKGDIKLKHVVKAIKKMQKKGINGPYIFLTTLGKFRIEWKKK